MKRTVSFFLSAVMIITSLFAVPFTASAADSVPESGKCGENVTYAYNKSQGTLVISGSGDMYDYSADAPAPWNKKEAALWKNNISTITINSGITSIGACAFQQLSMVEKITIPNTIKRIGKLAFDWCAQGADPLMTLCIPASVEEIGDNAFRGMSKLTAFSVSEDNQHYKSVDGVLYNKSGSQLILVPIRAVAADYTMTVPENVTSIAPNAFYKVRTVNEVYMPAGVSTVAGVNNANDVTADIFEASPLIKTVHYPENSAFDWHIYLQNINLKREENKKITGVCYKPDTCAHDISGYTEQVTMPTCIEQGYTTHICGACGFSYKDSYVDEKGHEYQSKVTLPTCTKQGYTTHTCTVCAYSYKDAYTAAKGHSYQNKVTAASVGKNGKITPTCSVCKATKSSTAIYAPKTLTLSTTNYTYNGKVKTPSVTVKDSKGKTLKKNTDYTLKYASGRKAVGKYSVKVTFKGKYSGTKTLYFTIKPKNTSITKLTAGKKKFTVKIKKYTTQTTGNEIQYSTSSKFTSAKTISTKNTTTAKTISSLKSGKKYYVRIRTYKTVKINGKSTKIYSSWSKAQTVKVK